MKEFKLSTQDVMNMLLKQLFEEGLLTETEDATRQAYFFLPESQTGDGQFVLLVTDLQ